jgi:hypothetical protein
VSFDQVNPLKNILKTVPAAMKYRFLQESLELTQHI